MWKIDRPGYAIGYAVIWCRDFRLQAVLRGLAKKGNPIALVDDTQRQSIVLCANRAALQWGVEERMPTVQALGRCPGLQVERPSAAAELAAGRFLLETALSWVPGIEETEPGILTLDIGSELEEEWIVSAERIQEILAKSGFDTAIGLGETPALARIAAQTALREQKPCWYLQQEQRVDLLDELPLTMAETGSDLSYRLQLWGIRSLGAYARLSREAVAARLGEEGVELWLRLTGRIRRPLRFAHLEQLFEEHHDFDYEVSDREPLLFLLNRFIEGLLVRIQRAGRAVTAVHLLLSYSSGACYAKRLRLPEPTLNDEILFRLVSGHLEHIEMKAAVVSMRLRFEPSDAIPSQRDLFGAGLKNVHQYQETLKRLCRIVGSESIGSPRPGESHRVDQFELVPLPSEIRDLEVREGKPPPIMGPVFRRFAKRSRARVKMRDGEPVMVESSYVSGVVIDCYGPWKSGGEWWHRDQSWTRTEWDVELLNQGLVRVVETEQGWCVEGEYS